MARAWKRSCGWYYYNDDRNTHGYVQPAACGGYLAVVPGKARSQLVRTIKEGKAFVESLLVDRSPV